MFICSFRLDHEDIERLLPEPPNYIIADGEVIDLNKKRPERVFFAWGNDTETNRQDSPWYTAHYQALTQGVDGIDYSNW